MRHSFTASKAIGFRKPQSWEEWRNQLANQTRRPVVHEEQKKPLCHSAAFLKGQSRDFNQPPCPLTRKPSNIGPFLLGVDLWLWL
jgi:hypothetical protein